MIKFNQLIIFLKILKTVEVTFCVKKEKDLKKKNLMLKKMMMIIMKKIELFTLRNYLKVQK